MSLITLPRHNYTYLAVETEGSKFTWSTTPRNNCSAQFWIDPETKEDIAACEQERQAVKLEGLKNMRKEYERLKLALGEE